MLHGFAQDVFNSILTNTFGSSDNVQNFFNDGVMGPYVNDWPISGSLPDYTINYTTYAPVASKLPKELVTSSFPPSDIYIDEDKAMKIEMAVAGYTKDLISIEQSPDDSDYIRVTLNSKAKAEDTGSDADEKETEKPKRVYLQQGIKKPDTSSVEFYVDPSKFDITTTKAAFDNGILTITIDKSATLKTLAPVNIQ